MPAPFYFISYTRSDAAFALQLGTDLKNDGLNVWIDQLDIPAGARWDNEVENALKATNCILVILTPGSVKSDNVLDEISFAIEERKRVIPILAAECETPFRIRRLQYIDFTKDYQEGLQELRTELNTGQIQPVPDTGEKKSSGHPKKVSFFQKYKTPLLVSVAALIILTAILITKNILNSDLKKNNTATNTTENIEKKPGIIDTTSKDSIPHTDNNPPVVTPGLPATVIPGEKNFKQGKKDIAAGKYTDAIINFTEAIRNNYKKGETFFYRANCYYSLKQLNSACGDYKMSGGLGYKKGDSLYKIYCDTLKTAREIADHIGFITTSVRDHRVTPVRISCAYSLTGDKRYLNSILKISYQITIGSAVSTKTATERAMSFKTEFPQSVCSDAINIIITSKKDPTNPVKIHKTKVQRTPVNIVDNR